MIMKEIRRDCTIKLEQLKSFARGEILVDSVLGAEGRFNYWDYDFACPKAYEMTYEDLYTAVKNLLEKGRSEDEIYYGWVEPVVECFADFLGLSKLIGYPDEDFLDALMTYDKKYFPNTSEEMAFSILDDMQADKIEYDVDCIDDLEVSELFKEYVLRMDLWEKNQKLPPQKWEHTKRTKKDYINFMDDRDGLDTASDMEKEFFKEFVDELCEEGDLDAIYIKGYACYGTGHPVYECDWEASRDCMLKLVEFSGDRLQAQAANTLGYIYYYGRCNDGVPEYDKAFKYFSLAAFFGYFEAKYKVGDMLLRGKGVPKNKTAASNLYWEVYNESYERFQNGDSHHKLADAALRIAGLYESDQEYFDAYYYYLQAKKAIEIRMESMNYYGDNKVLQSIEKGLVETKEKLRREGVDVSLNEAQVDEKIILNQLCYKGVNTLGFELNVIENDDNIKLIFSIKPAAYEDVKEVMITVPEVSYCEATDHVSLICPKKTNIKREHDKVMFDKLLYGGNGIRLYMDDIEVAQISYTDMIFDKRSQ